MKPAFDRKDAEIRRAAFNLFAELTRFGSCELNNFLEQIHANFTCFTLHINDEDQQVREAALNCFRRVSKLCSEEMHMIAQGATTEPSMYDQFLQQLAPAVIAFAPARLSSYLEQAVGYYKSAWSVIRANAASFSAAVLFASSAEARERVNVPTICAALVKLLREDSALVRLKTAKAISLLSNF